MNGQFDNSVTAFQTRIKFQTVLEYRRLYSAHSLLNAERVDFMIAKFQINQCALLAYQGQKKAFLMTISARPRYNM